MLLRLLWAAALLCALPAAANSFELHGFGPKAVSMAGAVGAFAEDYSAVFYNPALLVKKQQLDLGLAFSWNRASTSVTSVDASKAVDCAYCAPQDASGMELGALFPLAGKVKNRVALGVGLHMPLERFVRLRAADPQRPFWYQLNSNPERFVAYLGAGVKLLDSLSLGVGLQALQDFVGQGVFVQMDLFSRTLQSREIDLHLASRLAPVAGLSYVPVPRVRLGLTYRGQLSSTVLIPAQLELQSVGTVDLTLSGVAHFSPHTLVGSIAFQATEALTLTLDTQWMNWSAAPSPYLGVEIDLSGETLEALGLDEAMDLASADGSPGFADTLGARVGLEWQLTSRLVLRSGASYRPTPVPRQDVPGTNILDCNVLTGALGGRYSFSDPLAIFEQPLAVEFAGTFSALLPRTASKEATDEVPSYRYSGHAYGLTAAIRYEF